MVELLLAKNGVDPNSKNSHGQTPLSWAAEKGHGGLVELLLAKDGVDLNYGNIYGQTPLSLAAGRGHDAVVRLLLAKDGVNVNSKDTEYGRTPPWWAIKN